MASLYFCQMKNFKHNTPIQLRFADMDMMGHANNAAYATFIEYARMKYFDEVVREEGVWSKLEGLIIARLEIDFRKPIILGDSISVYTRCSRIGTKSFDMECVIVKTENKTEVIVAETKVVVVCFDYKTNSTIPISDERKKKVSDYEAQN